MANLFDVTSALRTPGQEFPVVKNLQIEDLELSGDPIRFENIALRGAVMSAEDRVSLRAHVDAQLKSRCVRCLGGVEMPISAEVDAVYARDEDAENPDLYLFKASAIDLAEAARDALLLEVPIRILCGEDCAGLCPVCGVDRNAETCTCKAGGGAVNPFEALKEFVHNDEEV